MRIHYIQHVPFENLGGIEPVLLEKGYQLTSTQMYDHPVFPLLEAFDWLIVMGGPMGIYDEETYSWLAREKRFIKEAIDTRKKVLAHL